LVADRIRSGNNVIAQIVSKLALPNLLCCF
jgi:hypothetical protein